MTFGRHKSGSLTSDANWPNIKCMRTTLDLEKPVLDGLKNLQKREKLSLGKIASRLLAEALDREIASKPAPKPFKWNCSPKGGAKAKVDILDKDALYRAMEEQ